MIEQIIDELHQLKIIDSTSVKVEPLSGGVSSFVWHLSDGIKSVVVKYPRQTLNLPVDWPVSLTRNSIEQKFFRYALPLLPDHIPKIIAHNSQQNWFCIPYFSNCEPWKDQLLRGVFSINHACESAKLLIALHKHSKNSLETQSIFEDSTVFETMRINPYFKALLISYPQFCGKISVVINRLSETKKCLIHGDFSPKNILVGEKMVLIDAETAVYGDPSFDVAFLINHLLLKGVFYPQKRTEIVKMVKIFLNTYGPVDDEPWLVELILWLMLARVDGWSPVEYLGAKQFQKVRAFAVDNLNRNTHVMNDLLTGYAH